MPIKGLLIGILAILIVAPWTLSAAVNIKEIEQLLENRKYSLVLEKSLNLLNTRSAQLTPIEAGTLTWFVGLAYQKNGNRDMAITYFKNLEQQYPAWDRRHLRTTSRLERFNRRLRRRVRSAHAYHSDRGVLAMLAHEAYEFHAAQCQD